MTARLGLFLLAASLWGCGDDSKALESAADASEERRAPADGGQDRASTGDADRDGSANPDAGQDACANGFYADADGDGFGDPLVEKIACDAPAGFVKDATDCNDACAVCHPGAEELCDTLDNDCDQSLDEGYLPSYQDCDGDAFAPATAEIWRGCARPAFGPSSCPSGTWTPQAPTQGKIDCNDSAASVNPGNGQFHESAAPSSTDDYDWNCDGVEERGFTNVTGGCVRSGTSCFGYWTAGAAVDCGGSAIYQECESAIVDGGLVCRELGTPANRAQVCR